MSYSLKTHIRNFELKYFDPDSPLYLKFKVYTENQIKELKQSLPTAKIHVIWTDIKRPNCSAWYSRRKMFRRGEPMIVVGYKNNKMKGREILEINKATREKKREERYQKRLLELEKAKRYEMKFFKIK